MENIELKQIQIEGLEDYLVSNNGDVYKKVSTSSLRGGYKSFNAYKTNKSYKVHQLVAKTFIPNNDENKIIVNHKDGNKLNNNVDNLEWTTASENVQHAIDTGLITVTKRKIYQCDLDGNIIKIHDTIRGAGKETGIDPAGIAKVCKGTRVTAGGYKWKFVDENPNEKEIDLTNFVEVKDYPNYLINKNSDVYSKPYKKLLKHHINNEGYNTIQLANKGNRKTFLVHRLVAINFLKAEPNKNQVCHLDRNKLNNCVSNLKWVSDSENKKLS